MAVKGLESLLRRIRIGFSENNCRVFSSEGDAYLYYPEGQYIRGVRGFNRLVFTAPTYFCEVKKQLIRNGNLDRVNDISLSLERMYRDSRDIGIGIIGFGWVISAAIIGGASFISHKFLGSPTYGILLPLYTNIISLIYEATSSSERSSQSSKRAPNRPPQANSFK